MNLKDAYNECERESSLSNPKSDEEEKFFRNLFANEDFWKSSDLDPESVTLKNVVCQVHVLG